MATKQARQQKETDTHIKQLFELFDKNSNGTISENELALGIYNMCGLNPTKAEIKEIFQTMGVTGEISFEKFDECLQHHFIKAKNTTKENEISILKSAFNRFDKDKSGYFDRKELKAMLTAFGNTVTDKEIDELFLLADSKKKDGKLHYDEFIKIFLKDVDV